jgi:hypothetical protein
MTTVRLAELRQIFRRGGMAEWSMAVVLKTSVVDECARSLRHENSKLKRLAGSDTLEMGPLWVDSREPRESTAARKDRIETEIAGRLVTIPLY